jgi:hypothetical protein
LASAGHHGHGLTSQLFGYLVMIIALSMIFLAVRDHRNKNLGGVIKFLPAFGLVCSSRSLPALPTRWVGKSIWRPRTTRSWTIT